MAAARGVLLFFRSLLVTGMTVFLAAAAHLVAGGMMPPGWLLLALLALLLPAVVFLARRQLSLTALVSVLGVGQLFLHEAFSLFPPAAACDGAGPAPHGHHMPAAASCGLAGPATDQLAEATGTGWVMTAAHLVAVLLTAVLLAHGEDALWRLLAWLRPLTRIVAPAVLPTPTPRPFTRQDSEAPTTCTDPRAHGLRGPPPVPLP